MKKEITIEKQQFDGFCQEKIRISLFKDPKELEKALPKNCYRKFLDLHEKAQAHPKKALKEIQELHGKYPSNDEITNLLTYVYLRLRKLKKAEKLIVKNYENNPASLLAKINYAELCLQKKSSEKIPQIFHHCYDLTKLYPKKKSFHFVAYRGFLNVMGQYHLAIEDRKTASHYHLLSHKLDPDYPGTKILGKKLYLIPRWQKLFRVFFCLKTRRTAPI